MIRFSGLRGISALGALSMIVSFGAGSAFADTPAPPDVNTSGTHQGVLDSLVPTHPRLLVDARDLERTRALLQADPLAQRVKKQLLQTAKPMLAAPPAEYKLIGPRLLEVSRTVLWRVSLLAGLYRLDGDRAYADRAIAEMLNAASFKNWNPSHFLDTAEMTAALGIGYDWLYDVLTPEQRAIIRQAIVEKGLKAGENVYQNQENRGWWVRGTNNWNQVCNGGLTIGALAIADEEPEIAERIIRYANESLPHAMNTFLAPNGGCEEGPSYWGYATIYTALYLAATKTALGTSFGFDEAPGLRDGGMFRIQTMGPRDWLFNYADGGGSARPAPQMLYFANAFDRPEYAVHERAYMTRHSNNERLPIMGLFWLIDPQKTLEDLDLPRSALFDKVMVFTVRSAWNDKDAFFVGFKGGDNTASHSHLDLGTFVLDAFFERWAIDFGSGNYNWPGYFSKPTRWSYYRVSTPGHNTLTIDGENQVTDAKAPIIRHSAFGNGSGGAFAIADLTEAYAPKVKQAHRGMKMSTDGHTVTVQDEVELADGVEAAVTWNLHTRADVQIDDTGRLAKMSQKGKTLYARIIEAPDGATFEVVSIDLPPPQSPEDDVQKLIISPKKMGGRATIVVQFSAEPGEGTASIPLREWRD